MIHCVNAESRSPSIAARYGVLLGHTPDEARRDVRSALDAWRGYDFPPTSRLWNAVGELDENRIGCDQCPYRGGETAVAADTSAFHPCV